MAREWLRFEPGYALGLARPQGRPPLRPGAPPALLVDLPSRRARRAPGGVRSRRTAARSPGWPTASGWRSPGSRSPGSRSPSRAVAGRCCRWFPFQLALTATYALFFAEPRYRLPIEMLASRSSRSRSASSRPRSSRSARRSRAGAPHGRARARARADRRRRLALGWPRRARRGRRRCAPATAGRSPRSTSTGRRGPCSGAPGRRSPPNRRCAGRRTGCTSASAPRLGARVRLLLGGGELPAGEYRLHLRLEVDGGPARCGLAGGAAAIGAGAGRRGPGGRAPPCSRFGSRTREVRSRSRRTARPRRPVRLWVERGARSPRCVEARKLPATPSRDGPGRVNGLARRDRCDERRSESATFRGVLWARPATASTSARSPTSPSRPTRTARRAAATSSTRCSPAAPATRAARTASILIEPERTDAFLGGGNIYVDKGLGTLWIPNITADPETGIGALEGRRDPARAARRRRPGRALHGADDALRRPTSTCPTTTRARSSPTCARCRAYRQAKPREENQLGFMQKMLFKVVGVQMHKPAADVVAPDRANKVEYGHYLVRVAACTECHSLDGERAAAGDRSPVPRGQRGALRGSRARQGLRRAT